MAERVGRTLPGGALLARAQKLSGAVWIVLLVAGALVVGIVVAIVGHNSNPLNATVLGGFTADNPHAFTVSYEVTKHPLATSECDIEVQDENHNKVGEVIDTIGPTANNATSTTKRLVIPTTGQGVTAIIDRCHLLHS
ncbi:MAG TPA: DUF4307 domain-containing protein [Mycobacteriales bacterium]